MSGASHTPGPWQVADTHPHWPKRCVVDCDGQTKPFTLIAEATEANARLIASAPELLEALETVLTAKALIEADEFEGLPDYDEWEVRAKAAIAKARGQ